MKGRDVPPKKQQPIVTVIFEGDTSWVCVYINDTHYAQGEVEGFYLGELLEQSGAHVHYLNTMGLVHCLDGEWPKTLTEALALPVMWPVGDEWYRHDPIRTLASINEDGVVPTPTPDQLEQMGQR